MGCVWFHYFENRICYLGVLGPARILFWLTPCWLLCQISYFHSAITLDISLFAYEIYIAIYLHIFRRFSVRVYRIEWYRMGQLSSILIIVLLDYLLPLNCGQKPYRQLKNWKKNEGNENAFVAFEFLLYSWNVLILFSLAFRVYFLNWIFYSWIAWFFPTSVCCFCFFVLVFVLCEFH